MTLQTQERLDHSKNNASRNPRSSDRSSRWTKRGNAGVLASSLAAFAFASTAAAQSNLQVSYGPNGLQTLVYQGVVLENLNATPSDAFHIWHMKATDLNGNVISTGQYGWGESNNGRAWNADTQTWTYNFVWGSISLQYVQNSSNLDMIVTTVNDAGSGIIFDGATIYPLGLNFPQLPTGFGSTSYNQFADNTTGPGVTLADYVAGEVAAVVLDAAKPVYSGFQPSGGGNGYTAIISGTSPDSLASYMPHNDRPVNPGQTDTYTISLRFAASGTSIASLAGDAYKSWAATYPPVLNWTDRRAIGTVYLASSPSGDIHQSGGFPNNPRRYFNDGSANDFDVTTANGMAAFQARVLAQAQTNVENLRLLSAQGAITWDIEGEEFPQNTSYVCSPDQIAQAAPEMESVVMDAISPYAGMKLDDAYFKTMTSAGFRVGVCVRPQQFTRNSDGTAAQSYLPDAAVAAQLIGKMKYAHDRWGATLFYIDSTVDSIGGVLDASIFQQAAAALPDSLVIPEETNPRHYAYTAPFKSFLFHGDLGTDSTVYNYYPDAFSANLINDVDPAKLAAAQAQLTKQVSQGDILMAHVDYWQENNPMIVEIYQNAGVRNPAPPPVSNATSTQLSVSSMKAVAGANVTFVASVSPAAATGVVSFYDGSVLLGSGALSSGAAVFSTSALAEGTHNLTAIYAGSATFAKSISSAATVTITGLPATTTLLTASATSVAAGSSVTFTVKVSPSAGGTVTLFDGANTVASSALNSGVAILASAPLTAGTHSFEAVYGGSTQATASTSAALVVTATVAAKAAAVTLSTSSTTARLGTTIRFVAKVAPAVATGTVTFMDGATIPGTAGFNSGSAALSTGSLAAGTHSLTAVYGGSAAYAKSASNGVTVTITSPAASTTTLLAASAVSVTQGTNVTLTATVKPGATGTVTFYDGPTVIGAGTLNAGTAAYGSSSLTAGTHAIRAAYGGSATYAASSSGTLTITVAGIASSGLAILSPGNDVTVSGSIVVSGEVNLFLDAAGTFLMVDGAEVGTRRITSAPYLYPLDTTTLTNGPHSVQLWGHDIGNNTRLSAPVVIQVSN